MCLSKRLFQDMIRTLRPSLTLYKTILHSTKTPHFKTSPQRKPQIFLLHVSQQLKKKHIAFLCSLSHTHTHTATFFLFLSGLQHSSLLFHIFFPRQHPSSNHLRNSAFYNKAQLPITSPNPRRTIDYAFISFLSSHGLLDHQH